MYLVDLVNVRLLPREMLALPVVASVKEQFIVRVGVVVAIGNTNMFRVVAVDVESVSAGDGWTVIRLFVAPFAVKVLSDKLKVAPVVDVVNPSPACPVMVALVNAVPVGTVPSILIFSCINARTCLNVRGTVPLFAGRLIPALWLLE